MKSEGRWTATPAGPVRGEHFEPCVNRTRPSSQPTLRIPVLTFQQALVARWPVLLDDAKALPVSAKDGARIRESWRFLEGQQVRS